MVGCRLPYPLLRSYSATPKPIPLMKSRSAKASEVQQRNSSVEGWARRQARDGSMCGERILGWCRSRTGVGKWNSLGHHPFGDSVIGHDTTDTKRDMTGIQTDFHHDGPTSATMMIDGVALNRPPRDDDLLQFELPALHAFLHRKKFLELDHKLLAESKMNASQRTSQRWSPAGNPTHRIQAHLVLCRRYQSDTNLPLPCAIQFHE